MAASVEDTILIALKTALLTILTANGYATDIAMVTEEPALISDIPDKPALAFWSDSRVRKNFAYSTSESELHIWIWGYVETQEGVYTKVRELMADVEKVLDSWTYDEFTDLKNTTKYFGGLNLISLFEMELVVSYRYAFGSP